MSMTFTDCPIPIGVVKRHDTGVPLVCLDAVAVLLLIESRRDSCLINCALKPEINTGRQFGNCVERGLRSLT